MNRSQAEYLKTVNTTEADILNGTASAAHRLEFSNRAADSDPVHSIVEPNDLQRIYLGDRQLSTISDPVDQANLAWLATLNQKSNDPIAPVEAPPKAINWATAELDSKRILSESPGLRIDAHHALEKIRKVGPNNVAELEVLLVKQFLK